MVVGFTTTYAFKVGAGLKIMNRGKNESVNGRGTGSCKCIA
jgi:hypothetical protein